MPENNISRKEAKSKPELRVRNLQRRFKVDSRGLQLFLRDLASELDIELSSTLVLVGDERMRVLNRVFRGSDRPTDVLSFPVGDMSFPDEDPYLGDIVISVETARRQALKRSSDLSRELRVLTLHGFLHLLGYDHESDNGEMRRLEYRLRRRLGITRAGNSKGTRSDAGQRQRAQGRASGKTARRKK